MALELRIGPCYILSAPSITTPLSDWKLHSMTRGNVIDRYRSNIVATGYADQTGKTPRADAVWLNGSPQDGYEFNLLDGDLDELVYAFPTGVKITNTTKDALAISQAGSTITPRSWALVPVADYDADTPGSWGESDHVRFIEKGVLEVTGSFSYTLPDGDDSLQATAYTCVVNCLREATSDWTGGIGLYHLFNQWGLDVGTQPYSVAFNNDGTKVAVANRLSNNIMIVDVATATVDDTIAVGTQPFSVAFNNDGTKVAVANNSSSNIMIVDVATATVDDTIAVGTNPRSVVFNNDGTKVAVANNSSSNIMIVDVATTSVTKTHTVGDEPYSLAFNNDGTKIAVANLGDDNIYIVIGT